MELEIPDVTDSVIISSTEIPDLENQIVPVATAVFEEIPPLNRDIEYNILDSSTQGRYHKYKK